VIDNYFAGQPPFKAKKSRNDFPDSFIFQTIIDLAATLPQLSVVVRDGMLFNSCKELPKVDVFESLEAFIESPAVSKIVHETTKLHRFEVLGTKIPHFSSEIKSTIEELLPDSISGETVKDISIPDDNHEATIYFLSCINEIDLRFSEMKYYGDGQFVLPFRVAANADLCYYIFKSDYYTFSEERMKSIVINDHNEHYYEATEDGEIEIEGYLSMTIPTEIDNDSDFFADLEIKIDRLDTISLIGPLDPY
jgi:hypothetical protein